LASLRFHLTQQETSKELKLALDQVLI
jgi:hypothetical protein